MRQDGTAVVVVVLVAVVAVTVEVGSCFTIAFFIFFPWLIKVEKTGRQSRRQQQRRHQYQQHQNKRNNDDDYINSDINNNLQPHQHPSFSWRHHCHTHNQDHNHHSSINKNNTRTRVNTRHPTMAPQRAPPARLSPTITATSCSRGSIASSS